MHAVRAIIAGTSLFGAAQAFAQTSSSARTIQVADSCTECGFTPVLVTTIDGSKTSEFAGVGFSLIARDTRGRIVLASSPFEVPPQVFDSSGRFLLQIAARGQGPGEIEATNWIDAGRDDSIRVYSPGRITTFDANLIFATVARPPVASGIRAVPRNFAMLSDQHIVLASMVGQRTGNGFVFPVTVYDATGRQLRSLALGDVVNGNRSVSVAAARDSGRFWTMGFLPSRNGYVIALHDQLGTELLRLERRPKWWMDRELKEPGSGSFPVAMAETADGRLVVLLVQPKANWRRIPLGPNMDVAGRTAGLVEILDVKTGRAVGHRALPDLPVAMLGSTHFATYRDVNDYPVLKVWRLNQ